MPTLFLSANCFQLPLKYLQEEETNHTVDRYMAYLTDNTNLIPNPGLKVIFGLPHLINFFPMTFEESAIRR